MPLNSNVRPSKVLRAAVTAVSLTAVVASSLAESLCTKGEVTYFSCNTAGGKVASLCGAKIEDRSTLPTYLQYRYGTIQELELVYPSTLTNSTANFNGVYFSPAGEGLAAVVFNPGIFEYSIVGLHNSGGQSFSGVQVMRGEVEVSRKACLEAPVLQSSGGVGFIQLSQGLEPLRAKR